MAAEVFCKDVQMKSERAFEHELGVMWQLESASRTYCCESCCCVGFFFSMCHVDKVYKQTAVFLSYISGGGGD